MELRQMRYFLAVAEELHFGRAANRLGIQQPPLSRQIKNLETELAVTLFDRTNRRVRLTPAGKYLMASAAAVVEQADRIRNAVGLIQDGQAGLVRIGYVGSAMHSVLPDLLRGLRLRYPEIYPELVELDGESQVHALQSGDLDVGFLRPPIRAKNLDMHVGLEEPFVLVLPSGHRLAEARELPLDALADESFIGFCRSCAPGMADRIVQICNDAGFSPRVVHETSQLNALLRLVEIGFGYSIVPTSVQAGYKLSLCFRELNDVSQRAQLAVLYREDGRKGPGGTLIEMIRTLGPAGFRAEAVRASGEGSQ